jgi:UDP-N-acetylmuramate-alanine ligase
MTYCHHANRVSRKIKAAKTTVRLDQIVTEGFNQKNNTRYISFDEKF